MNENFKVFVFYHENCMHFLLGDSILNFKKNTLLKDSYIPTHLTFRGTLCSRDCFTSVLQRRELECGEATCLAQGHSGKTSTSNQALCTRKYCVGFCPGVTSLKDGGQEQCYETSIIGIHILIQCLSSNIWQRCWKSKEHPFSFFLQSPAEN